LSLASFHNVVRFSHFNTVFKPSHAAYLMSDYEGKKWPFWLKSSWLESFGSSLTSPAVAHFEFPSLCAAWCDCCVSSVGHWCVQKRGVICELLTDMADKSGKNYPVGFPQYAHATVSNGDFRDLEKLWQSISATDASLATRLGNQSVVKKTADLSQKLIDAVKAARAKMANSRSARAKSAPPARQAPSAQKSRNNTPLHEMQLVGAKFTIANGDEVPIVGMEEFSTFCRGVILGTRNKTGDVLHKFDLEAPFKNPLAIICRSSSFEDESKESRARLQERYHVSEAVLHFDDKGSLNVVSCLVFQLGLEMVQVLTCTIMKPVIVNSAVAKFTQISVQIPNLEGKANWKAKAEADFAKTGMLALGLENVFGDSVPKQTGYLENIPFKRTKIDIVIGKVLVKTEKLVEVWRRNGLFGVLLRPWQKDEFYAPLNLPGHVDLDEARDLAKNLGPLAYGIMTTAGGFAIRVEAEKKEQTRQKLHPELANAIGSEVLALAKCDAVMLEVSGIPKHMPEVETVQSVSMRKGDGSLWTFEPLHLLHGAVNPPGRKTLLCKAAEHPPHPVIPLQLPTAFYHVYIKEHVPPKFKLPPMTLAKLKAAEEPEDDKPVRITTWAARLTGKWADEQVKDEPMIDLSPPVNIAPTSAPAQSSDAVTGAAIPLPKTPDGTPRAMRTQLPFDPMSLAQPINTATSSDKHMSAFEKRMADMEQSFANSTQQIAQQNQYFGSETAQLKADIDVMGTRTVDMIAHLQDSFKAAEAVHAQARADQMESTKASKETLWKVRP
jgi:hypothetical protein